MTRNVKYQSRDVKHRRGCAGILRPHCTTPLETKAHGDNNFDVLIIGAGLSGISMACHLQTECPGKRVGTARTAQGDRRHLGPVPLPGRPLRLGHVHLRLPVSPVERAEGAGRRPVDPPATSTTRRASTASTRTSASASRPRRPAGRASTSAGPSAAIDEESGEACTFTCSYLVSCTGYYNHDARLPAELSRHRALQGADASIPSTGRRSWTTAASAWS